MSTSELQIDLGDASLDGVYFVADSDPGVSMFDTLARTAGERGLAVARIDLAEVRNKSDALTRMADALALPPDFGHNWDALADSLRDLSWLKSNGYVLLIEHSATLRQARPKHFNTLLDILDEAATTWLEAGTPFFVFLQMSDDAG